MIIRSFELDKIKDSKKKFLFYGVNEGHKKEIIKNKFQVKYKDSIYNYDESEILNNIENFYNNILTKSFFENEKLIIINRATDKIKILIEEILEKKIEDLVIILNANNLEKKSKLRSFFEKSRIGICVAFYEDNNQTLQTIISSFFRNCKISISQQAMNLIVQRCRGDRQNLNTELQKIECFIKNKNKIDINDLLKLTNLAENYDVSELVDSCLSKNKRKTINILNENNYSLDDCVFIIRTFLIKTKRLLKLCEELKIKKNIDAVIMSCKPPIFWKDKEVVKQQIQNWSYNNIKNLVFKINEIELLIKKNSNSSINLLSDFIIEQTTIISN